MKNFILILFLLFYSLPYLQTTSPVLEDFNSLNQVGDSWKLITGQPNTGSHGGLLCYNLVGNYLDDEYYSFESVNYDFTTWTQVDIEFSIQSSLRNGDLFAFYYFDDATGGWSGYDLSNLTGTYVITIPTTASLLSFDLNTNTNGNINGKYAHVDYIYITDPGTPLPVELVDFAGYKDDNCNHVMWVTESENNSDYYNLEWADNGFNWQVITSLPAAGNSIETIEYSYYDCSPRLIVNYYRLIQYDIDGELQVFGPIVVDNSEKKKVVIKYTDLNGKSVNPENYSGFLIKIYEDGTTEKVIK